MRQLALLVARSLHRFTPQPRSREQRFVGLGGIQRWAGTVADVEGGASSVFDPLAFGEGDGAAALAQEVQRHMMRNAEFYARHQEPDSWRLALDVGPAPSLVAAALRGRDVRPLSSVVRTEGAGRGSDGGKLLVELPDGRRVETVIIAAKRSGPPTVCVSSQAGCAMACRFCDTGLMGDQRAASSGGVEGGANASAIGGGGGGIPLLLGLPTWAILEQVFHAEAMIQREDLGGVACGGAWEAANVVFMGMGEPLLNYRPVLAACRALIGRDSTGGGDGGDLARSTVVLQSPNAAAVVAAAQASAAPMASPERNVTVSTVGVAPRIASLARTAPRGLRLALSLHAPTQELREQLLPRAARAWPLPELLESVRTFEAATNTGVLIEYILLNGVNDGDDHAQQLAALISDAGLRCAGVNLIPYNPTTAGAAAGYHTPSDARCKAFRSLLRRAGVPNPTIRFSTKRGRDFFGACGQLGLRGLK